MEIAEINIKKSINRKGRIPSTRGYVKKAILITRDYAKDTKN